MSTAALSSSPAAAAASSLTAVCTQANLAPIYGTEKASLVVKYALEEFLPYADNFASPMRAQIQRGQSQGLLLTMQHTQSQNGVKVWVGIFFPPAFPSRGPQTALLLAPNQSIRPSHRIVAPNGAVRMELLDCGPNPHMLLEILVSMIVVLDGEDSPVVEKNGGIASSNMLGLGSTSALPAVGGTTPSAGGVTISTTNAPDYSHIQLSPQQQEFHDLLVSDLFQLNDKYLGVRMETLAHEDVLKATIDSLKGEANALQQEADLLRIARNDKAQLISAMDAYANTMSGNVVPIDRLTATDCIEPENELHAQALDLLATVNAYEDQLNFLEKCLARRSISGDQYLRYVNTIAREEFQARFMYNRVIDKIQQSKTMQTLLRKFNGQGLDEQVIGSVLAANSYSLLKAEKALAEMVS